MTMLWSWGCTPPANVPVGVLRVECNTLCHPCGTETMLASREAPVPNCKEARGVHECVPLFADYAEDKEAQE